MAITDFQGLDALCTECGIALDYHDIRGLRHEPTVEVKQALLAAMDLAVGDDADISRQLENLQTRDWQSAVAPVLVMRLGESPVRLALRLEAARFDAAVEWTLDLESGQTQAGHWDLDPRDAVGKAVVDGRRLLCFAVTLPDLGETGYHRLKLTTADGGEARSIVIVAPATCYQPAELEAGNRIWGISLQLYSLRSRRNWGIGDFTDLHGLIDKLAPLGIDAIGLNPLHALFPHLAQNASPYSPSSRDFLNPVYLDIEAIDEFSHDGDLQRQIEEKDFQAQLKAVRDLELIDYRRVWALKLAVLEKLYRSFRNLFRDSDSARIRAFREFQQAGGKDLYRFALFEALQAFFYRQDSGMDRWQAWPSEFRTPDSAAVAQWAEDHRDAIEFHQYLQWNAELQLSAAQEQCRRQGMRIGLYRDLAVGNAKSSAECWSEPSDYAGAIGIGAPPDDFSPRGQNWALPPIRPRALIDKAYRPFIRTLRANMQHAGALRIDHIMGLMRQFWVPPDRSPDQGTYLAYPLADLLGIVALESRRNRCLVIGEDLGTVPNEVRHALYVNRILSYRVLYFEKDWHHGVFKPPGDYPRYALCTSASHDLPTLQGFWQETDLALREKLGLSPSSEFDREQRAARQRDKQEILNALARQGLLASPGNDPSNPADIPRDDLLIAVQRYLARSPAMLMMVQIEDLLFETNQVNVPGTIDEHPNWRQKLSLDVEDWGERVDLATVAQAVNGERGNGGG